jgi:hypothetical protein
VSLPPFFEPDFFEPALDLLVDEVLLEAAAARFVEPELFFAEDFVPVDFEPPRADEVDFFEAVERAPDFAADFAPPLAADLEADDLEADDLDAPFAEAFEDVRAVPLEALLEALLEAPLEAPLAAPLEALLEAPFVPVFDADLEALFFAPPLFAEDFAAPLEAPPEDFFAPVFFEDEAPLLAEDFVPFLALDEELLDPLFLAGPGVADPPDEPVLLV